MKTSSFLRNEGRMKMIGVYGIMNKISKKWYIGSSSNIQIRWQRHLHDLKKGVHTGVKLLRAWRKYGNEAWDWIVLEIVENPHELISREQYWLDHFNSYKNGYNSLPFVGKSLLGTKQSAETIAKRVATRKANGGFSHSEETKIKISNTQRGKSRGPMSEAQRKLLSALKKGKMSDEERKKCGDRARGRKLSLKQREQLKVLHTGMPLSLETRAKMSESAKRLGPKDPNSIRKMLIVKRQTLKIKLSKKTCEKYDIPFE